MAKIKLFVNPKGVKKDGYAVVYAITHIHYKTVKINTGISVDILNKKWDFKEQRIIGYSKKAKDDNMSLQKVVSSINDIMINFRLQGIMLTAEKLKKEWTNPTILVNFYDFAEKQIKYMKVQGKAYNTIDNYSLVIEQLKLYKPEIAMSEIDETFIQNYLSWLKKECKNSNSTIKHKVAVIRLFMLAAKKQGIIKELLFDKPKIRSIKKEKVFLTEQELKLLWNKYINGFFKERIESNVRQFLFMSFTGIRISDLRRITNHDIEKNVLMFKPVKTEKSSGATVRIPLCDFALKLINDENSIGELLFNKVIATPSFNRILKVIFKEKLGIQKEISTHSGRHTFATLWLDKTKDVAKLQKLLGHSTIMMTMQYVHITEESIKEEMINFSNSLSLDGF